MSILTKLLLSVRSFGASPPPPPYEDFTTYTEVDPNNRFTVEQYKITFAGLLRNDRSYVYKDKGVNFFDADFEIQLQTRATSWVLNSFCELIGISNVVTWKANDGTRCLNVSWGYGYESDLAISGMRIWIAEWHNGIDYYDYSIILSLNTTYYLTFKRTGAVLTCEIYSDVARTILVDTLTVNLHSVTQFRYIYGARSLGEATGTQAISGYTENLYVVSA